MEILLDKDGKAITQYYLVKSPIWGNRPFNTLEEAKEFSKRDTLPRVYFVYYHFEDMKYYAFTAYSLVPEHFVDEVPA